MLSTNLYSQATSADCLGAIPVCSNFYNYPILSLESDNITNEIQPSLSCLSDNTTSGIWYTFTAQTGGDLNFTIDPQNNADDYDWALFNITGLTCSDIYGMSPISCNYNSNPGNTGANGLLGNQNEPTVPVVAGQVFVLFISSYSNAVTGSNAGYSIDFSASTASIPDATPPTLLSATPNNSCGADNINITFNENIACNSLNAADFTLTGPGGPYTITGVTSPSCAAGGDFSTSFEVSVSPPMNTGGAYVFTMVGGAADICGNNLVAPPPFNIAYNALITNVVVTNATCGNNDGQATIGVIGGTPPYTYDWDDPANQTSATATGLARGSYSCIVTDINGCTHTVYVTISDPTSFTFTVQQQSDTCSKGNGILTVNVLGTTSPYNYQFNGFDNLANPVYSDGVGDQIYIVRVTDNLNCWWADTLTMLNYINPDLVADFYASDYEVDFMFPVVDFYNTSQDEVSIQWFMDGITTSVDPYKHTFSTYGDFPVTLVATDKDGCTDTAVKTVVVKLVFALYIPNTFTPNGNNLNEEFKVIGVGVDSSNYNIVIFNRIGEAIWESSDITQGWNGRSKQGSTEFPQGTYAYMINCKDIYGVRHKQTGTINLIR